MHPAFFMPIPSTQQKPYPHLRQTTPPFPFLLPTPIPAPALFPTYISRPRRHLTPPTLFPTRQTHVPYYSPRHSSSAHILNTYFQLTSSARNTHISSIHISGTYIQTASRTARYALRITDRHIHKVISVIRPFREHRGIHTPYPTLGADLTKKGGEFSFASPIVLS